MSIERRATGYETYDPAWWKKAVCKDVKPDDMFPVNERNQRIVIQQVCVGMACPVKFSCLVAAIEAGDDEGVWGAKTPAERKRINRQQLLTIAHSSRNKKIADQVAANTNPEVVMGTTVDGLRSFPREIGSVALTLPNLPIEELLPAAESRSA